MWKGMHTWLQARRDLQGGACLGRCNVRQERLQNGIEIQALLEILRRSKLAMEQMTSLKTLLISATSGKYCTDDMLPPFVDGGDNLKPSAV